MARCGDGEILVPVDEKNLGVLKVGQTAQVVADAYPNQPFEAVLTFIAPGIDSQRGTVDVRLRANPEPDFLLEDMTVSVNILTASRDEALVVPNDALNRVTGDDAFVWRARAGKAEQVAVRLGLRGLVMTEIVAGLEP